MISNPNYPLYPWQEANWQQLSGNVVNNRISHALLFNGPAGLGKYQIAMAFKDSLLCSGNTLGEQACGTCRYCKMQEHPDFKYVTFEVDEKTGKKSSTIKIDQIRKLIEFSHLHTHFGLAKVIIIQPAEAMTNNASNALLKILEEPPQNTYFILITNEFPRLSATIKSRCQNVKFTLPDLEQSKIWLHSFDINKNTARTCLKLAYNAPLMAKDLADSDYIKQHSKFLDNLISIVSKSADPMTIAQSWLKIEAKLPLLVLYSCLSDLILLNTLQSNSDITNEDNRQVLQQIANNVNIESLFIVLDKIVQAKHQIQSNVAILGVYEDILNLWQRLTIKVIL